MKITQFYLFASFLLLTFVTNSIVAQTTCLSGYNRFTAQEQIDNFLIENPSCTEIEGQLVIWPLGVSQITNLEGFKNLTSVNGFLQIRDCDLLEDVNGLRNLKDVGGHVYIQGNTMLNNFVGFDSLQTIGGGLFVGQNSVLETLEGLEGIAAIGGDLVIRDNVKLQSIDGIRNIDPNTIKSSDSGKMDLIIINNTQLFECAVKSICEVLDIENLKVKISNNKTGCNKISEIKEICSISPTCIPIAKTFDTQEEIDNFANDYPGCIEVLGDIVINESVDSSIVNLDGLSQIVSIKGALSVSRNKALTNLEGLDELVSVGRFISVENNHVISSLKGIENVSDVGTVTVSYNPLLISLEGLEGIEHLERKLDIISNPLLRDLSGLDNLKSANKVLIKDNDSLSNISALGNVDSIFRLEIYKNKILEDLTGLEKLEVVGSSLSISYNYELDNINSLSNLKIVNGKIQINNNHKLTSLDGLQNVTPDSIKSLELFQNFLLTTCNIKSICDFFQLTDTSQNIYENGSGCYNESEIISSCNSGVKDLPSDRITIFPNPSSDILTIDIHSNDKKIKNLVIRDMIGKIVYSKNVVGEHHFSISVSSYEPGIYFCEFNTKHGIELTKKIIVF